MSEGSSHLRNEAIRRLTKELISPHHFTLPYCPWSSRTVKRIGKDPLRAARAVLSQLQLCQNEWPRLVPLFQSGLNNSSSRKRNNIASSTAFTGRPASPPVLTFLRSSDSKPVILAETKQERTISTHHLIKEMDRLHPMTDDYVKQMHDRMQTATIKGELANFTEGYYFLVARDEFYEGKKLCLR